MSSDENSLKIGKVAKLTGITQDRLRVWERRYAAIEPTRSSSDRRLYSFADVSRLKLMKQLIDGGDSISRIAQLDLDALQKRLDKTQLAAPTFEATIASSVSDVIIVGDTLAETFNQELNQNSSFKVIKQFDTIDTLLKSKASYAADILLVEQNTLGAATFELIQSLKQKTQANHCLLIYRFATSVIKKQLSKAAITLIRAPINTQNLNRYIQVLSRTKDENFLKYLKFKLDNDVEQLKEAPERRYDDKTLARIAAISPTIECECPKHLADLLADLTAFETYSKECENITKEDAALHAYLNKTASHARHLIENAMSLVLEHEGIEP